MKITVRKKKTGIAIKFRAQSDGDGAALKDAILEAAREGLSAEAVVGKLKQRGYELDSRAESASGFTVTCSQRSA